MPWPEAPRALDWLLEAAGHLQLCRLPTKAGGTRQLLRMEPLISHVQLMGSERSCERWPLEEPSGFYRRPKAGLVAATGSSFFPKAISKT